LATHKSAEKRARQSIRRQKRNLTVLNSVRTYEKKVVKAIEKKSGKEAADALREFTSKAMSAVSKGVMKKQTASRHISRLSTRVSALAK
jgi:small subunit ribosomal protein S20